MGRTKADRLAGELDDFITSSPNVEAAAVVTFDGLTMASALPDVMDDDRVGAMSAALLSLGEQAARGLGRGELRQIFVEADGGFVFLMSAKDEAVLVAVADADAKIGFILFEMRRAAESIGDVLSARAVSAVDEPSAPASASAPRPPSVRAPSASPSSSYTSHSSRESFPAPSSPGSAGHVVREDWRR